MSHTESLVRVFFRLRVEAHWTCDVLSGSSQHAMF